MALSNIFREPRREITETLVGMAAFSVPITMSAVLATYLPVGANGPFDYSDGTAPFIISFLAWTFVLLCGSIILGLTIAVIHTMGEDLSDALESRGIQIRPRQRY